MPIFGVILVVILAYVGTKLLSKKYGKISSGKNIKVLERVSLGQDKLLVLVTVNKKAFLLGVTDKSFSTVTEFTEEEVVQAADNQKMDFSSLLSDSMKKYSPINLSSKKSKNRYKQ